MNERGTIIGAVLIAGAITTVARFVDGTSWSIRTAIGTVGSIVILLVVASSRNRGAQQLASSLAWLILVSALYSAGPTVLAAAASAPGAAEARQLARRAAGPTEGN